jgi:hypothetical protein
MTSELFWLLLTAIFAASLWIPYIVGINTTDFEGKDDIFIRPPDLKQMEPWVHRSYRAHLNLLEQFLDAGYGLVSVLIFLAAYHTRHRHDLGPCAPPLAPNSIRGRMADYDDNGLANIGACANCMKGLK